MKKLLLALGACALPVSIFAATYVVPVATARLKDRIYSTTLAFHNEGSLPARCEAIYAVPDDPKRGTLRATYELAAGGAPLVEEDVLRDVGALGTMRIACTSDVAIAARIQSSRDGLIFDEGRTFAALREDGAVAHGALPTIRAFGDVVVAEVAGKPVTVEAIVHGSDGVEFGSKTYDVPAFAQQLVNLSKAHAHANVVIVDVRVIAGDGAIVGADETRDRALLKMAVRMRPETRAARNVQARKMDAANTTTSPAPSVIRSLGTAAFKAAPFQDPFTGLIFMRERWYDPQTATFLSPDPEGYADSASLYSYCHGDPVNCTDPTGRLGDGGDLRADFREKENAERARRSAEWCRANPVECMKRDVRGGAIMRGIGGAGQMVAGVSAFSATGPLPEPLTKTFGAITTARGLENLGTAAVEFWTGQPHDTPTRHAMYLALIRSGQTPARASNISGWTETGIDVATALALATSRSARNNSTHLCSFGSHTRPMCEVSERLSSNSPRLDGRRKKSRAPFHLNVAQLACDTKTLRRALNVRQSMRETSRNTVINTVRPSIICAVRVRPGSRSSEARRHRAALISCHPLS